MDYPGAPAQAARPRHMPRNACEKASGRKIEREKRERKLEGLIEAEIV
jgi:hypothetical protein